MKHPKVKTRCFVCGAPCGTKKEPVFVAWTAESTDDETEYRCAQCSFDEGTGKAKLRWMRDLIEVVVRKKKARLVLQEETHG